MYVNSPEGIKPSKDTNKESLNKLIGQQLAEAIKNQGLNENLNEQEGSSPIASMDSEKAYDLVKFSKENGAKIIFLGSGLIEQIRDWAKENNKDMGVLSRSFLFKEEDHYDHFHIRLQKGVKGCPVSGGTGGSSGTRPKTEPERREPGDDSEERQQSRLIKLRGLGQLPGAHPKNFTNDFRNYQNAGYEENSWSIAPFFVDSLETSENVFPVKSFTKC